MFTHVPMAGRYSQEMNETMLRTQSVLAAE